MRVETTQGRLLALFLPEKKIGYRSYNTTIVLGVAIGLSHLQGAIYMKDV
jgi:hypothetical protein